MNARSKSDMSENKESCGAVIPNLLDLSADMHTLLRDSVMSDFCLFVNGKSYIYCHRDVLKFRSKWFLMQIREAESRGATEIAVTTENIPVLEAVMLYIYTGNLKLIESLDVSLLDLYQAAKVYGLGSLLGVLTPIVKEKEVKEIMQNVNFLWAIKYHDFSTLVAPCAALDGFSLCGTDRWKLEMKPMPRSEGSEPRNGIYITRQAKESHGTSHVVKFVIYVHDKTKMVRYVFSNQYTLLEDGEYLLTSFLSHSEVQKSAEDLMPGDVLSLTCQLTMWAKVGFAEKFRLEGKYRRCISNELQELSHSLYNMQKYGGTHDIKIEQPLWTVKIHSYMYNVRCHIPKDFMHQLGIMARLGCIGWSSFVLFMYTGQVRYLHDHGRDIYYGLSLTQFTEARRKYSNYLAKNLMLENALDLLCDAVKYEDKYLMGATANFLASRSNSIADSKTWIRIAQDKVAMITESFP